MGWREKICVLRFFSLLPLFVGVLFFMPAGLQAAEPTKLVVTTNPQTVVAHASSSVIVLQLRDDLGQAATSTITLRVVPASASLTGQFSTASISGNTCGVEWGVSSLTVARGTSNKGLCYLDSTPGIYDLTFSIVELAAMEPASQTVVIAAAQTPTTTPTTTPPIITTPTTTPPDAGANQPSLPAQNPGGAAPFVPVAAKTGAVKISEILPNPAGEDDGNETVELHNAGGSPVNLENWYLDDKTESDVKTRAYKLPSLPLAAGAYAAVTLPQSSFALNNTGGDVLNLYYPDKTLADAVAYSGTAQEGVSYQKAGSAWVWAPPTFGAENFRQAQTSHSAISMPAAIFRIWLSEFLPNPAGQDEGKEWVELYNPNDFSVSLGGFILDDEGASGPGSSAWVLPESAVIMSKEYLQLIIPEDKFALNNSGGDALRLFSPAKVLLEEIAYLAAPEDQAYGKDQNSRWNFGRATAGEENLAEPLAFHLIISEILPNPADDQDEFVEIYNPGTEAVDLGGFVLQIGARKKVFPALAVLAGGYLIFTEDELPGHLSNSGQTVTLYDYLGLKTAALAYGKAAPGQAYASNDGKNYHWTDAATPGQANDLVLGAAIAGESLAAESVSASGAATAAPAITRAQAQTLLASNQALQAQLAAMQASLHQLQANAEKPYQLSSASNAPAVSPAGASWGWGLVLLAVVLTTSGVTAWLVLKWGKGQRLPTQVGEAGQSP